MQWSDQGMVLSTRRHGETSAIVQILTKDHGRHAGLVRGGSGRKARGVLQSGNEVSVTWRARLEDQLGTFTVELARPRVAMVLDDPLRLAGLVAATELVEITLAERQPNREVHAGLTALMDAIESDPDWSAAYVRWELAMLAELGFGLDVAHAEPGAMISSRSGEPVPPEQLPGAGERLLPMPDFLRGGAGDPRAIVQGLALTGLFIERALDAPGRVLPSRTRLVERFARLDTTSGVKSGNGRKGD
ncbi:MAG: DNA repair protein RecO [Alphaproteobacteria bacterium]|jgi:DNA repair protein RecO (recombination protein O)|nr:DNA repair protein RecO [Alphaproteobacteria bacterium]MBT4711795.1 DNA repair protein RecO [Alphaproteobacteria bacterium]MBT5860957.1 DNA repair protein RecO [Alphaproteobacteria bacterium]